MKKALIAIALGVFLAITIGSAYAYEATTGPTGLIRYDKNKAYYGYTIFSPMIGCKTSYMIDMEGNIVHTIDCDYTPGLHEVLLENGNILRGGAVDATVTGCPIHFGGVAGIVQELDWDGNVVWEQQESSPTHTQHHTFNRMPNGNTQILIWEYHSKDEAIAAGRTEILYGPEAAAAGQEGIWPDMVKEYDANNNLVWEWHVWDHLGAGDHAKFDINYALPEPIPETGFQNYMGNADWTHFNTVGYWPMTGQMIVNSRNLGEWYLIDRDGTTTETAAGPAGDILYRWGNPSTYGQGDRPSFLNDGDQELFGPHCALPILEGCPGYGHILIFDNGWMRPERGRSRAVEVDPTTVDSDTEIYWSWETNCYTSFYTEYQGACQRLPNGNTFITSTGEGHFIEVTPEGEIVWEFINPVFMGRVSPIFYDENQSSGMGWNMVHRAHRYGPDYPGLAGRDLPPMGTFVDRAGVEQIQDNLQIFLGQ